LSSKAVNHVPAFKLRLDENKQVWSYECIHPSATVLREDETFNFCNFFYIENYNLFIKTAEKARELALIESPLSNVDNQNDLVYYSMIPWLKFTSFKHASSNLELGVPKIVFGKIYQSDDKSFMPISIELHHALADGLDIAKYIKHFEECINALL
jgi:chloramphenicol O-acetyltransferase type A